MVQTRGRLIAPDSLKHGIYQDYMFAWNQIGANNVFRLRWDVCGQKITAGGEMARGAGYLTQFDKFKMASE